MRHKAGHRALAACRALAATLALAMAAACTSGSADSPYFGKVSPPAGQEMRYKGRKPKAIESWVVDGALKRGYYYCPACKQGLFPPGRPARTRDRGVE